MRIVISDVHEDLKRMNYNAEISWIGTDVTDFTEIGDSAHGRGTIYIRTNYIFYSGTYITCLDDEGYPI